MATPAQIRYIEARATAHDLDPQAVIAIAGHEGLGGGVGDNGTSLGPFQLHADGALPRPVWAKGADYAKQWAWSPQGIDYALQSMAKYARGLTGEAAVAAISKGFERPADPQAEITDAMSHYGSAPTPASAPAVVAPGGTSPGADAPLATDPSGIASQASAFHDQAMSNLHDIATGGKPTDELGALATMVQHFGKLPTISMTPQAINNPDSLDAHAVTLAQKYIGVKYTWGGESPQTGFDCSGLVQMVWKQLGVNVPRTTYEQWDTGHPVKPSQLRPGDAVFFTGSDPQGGQPGHEGMYIGDGKFIEAPGSGKVVRVSVLADRPDFVGARRFA